VAKFEGDRPKELGGLALKIKKETAEKCTTAGNCRSGRPNIIKPNFVEKDKIVPP